MKPPIFLSLLIAPLLLTGCASILDGGPKVVQINSNPEGVKVTISNRDGREISVLTTPTTIALKRSSGPFEPEDYKLIFEEPGYYTDEIHIESTIDNWYFGNVIFGGLIGLLFVDPSTGDMFTLSPTEINHRMISTNQPAYIPSSTPIHVVPVPLSPPITTKNLGF